MEGFSLTSFQQRTWQLEKLGFHLGVQAEVLIHGALEYDRLKCALRHVVTHHEALRISFRLREGMLYPVQVPDNVDEVLLTYQYHPGMHNEERPGGLFDTLGEWEQKPFSEDWKYLELILVKQDTNTHRMILKQPAITGDVQSLMIVLREMAHYYAAPPVEVTRAFEDHPRFEQLVQWQQELKKKPERQALNYWDRVNKELARQEPLSLALRQEITIGAVPVASAINMSPGTEIQLKWAANEMGISTEIFLLTCWKILIWNYTGFPENLVLGKTDDGRYTDIFREIAGPLCKVLPLHSQPQSTMSFHQYARHVNAANNMMSGWQEYYDCCPETAAGLKDIPHYHVGFRYNQLEPIAGGESDLSFNMIELHCADDVFTLRLNCDHSAETLSLRLYYQSAAFTSEAIDCIKQQLGKILSNAIDNPSGLIQDLLTAGGDEILSSQFCDTDITEAPETLLEGIENRVRAYPENIAIRFRDRTLTYADLNEMANNVADRLINVYAISNGDIVILQCYRSEMMVPALLGIMKTGAAFLPVDPSCPAQRLQFIIDDSGAKALLTDSHVNQVQREDFIVSLDDNLLLSRLNDHVPKRAVAPEDPAYVIYTSGSTGQPKGAVILHRSLVNYLHWFTRVFQITHTDKTILFASIAYDLPYTSLWSAILAGSTLVIAPESVYFDPLKLSVLLKEESITYLKITPGQFRLLTECAEFNDRVADYLLRLVLLGGEALRMQDIERCSSLMPKVQFVNHYGPTETTIGVMVKKIDLTNKNNYSEKLVFDTAVWNNKVRILKEGRHLLPVGVTGEICIIGTNVAKGYLNRDDLTAENFLDDSFEPGLKLYRTGDLGRMLPDGCIEFLGRADFQVKINGYRIELAEIERKLNACEGVAEAVVMALTDNSGEKYLQAFLNTMEEFSPAHISTCLAEELPEYMIPSRFVMMKKFPLLPNGKIDRIHLASIESKTELQSPAYVPPVTDIQKKIISIWKDILGVAQIGIHDNFFDHGGNSLKLIRMLVQLSRSYPGQVNITDLFKYNTVSSIATFLGQAGQDSNELEIFEV